jgi:hypothetical protein
MKSQEESDFPEISVQLSEPLRRKAEKMAMSQGISIEEFVLRAVAEKIEHSEAPSKKQTMVV